MVSVAPRGERGVRNGCLGLAYTHVDITVTVIFNFVSLSVVILQSA